MKTTELSGSAFILSIVGRVYFEFECCRSVKFGQCDFISTVF